jgi:acyl carrier protein
VAPQTAVEHSIATLWREALQAEQIGLHDNFFDLGGHSLLLAQVHSKVERMFDCKLSLVDMFKYPTVRLLAQRISQAAAEQPHKGLDAEQEAQWKAGRSRMQQRRVSQRRDM